MCGRVLGRVAAIVHVIARTVQGDVMIDGSGLVVLSERVGMRRI